MPALYTHRLDKLLPVRLLGFPGLASTLDRLLRVPVQDLCTDQGGPAMSCDNGSHSHANSRSTR